MNNAIEITDLRKDYKDFSLNDISFSLPTGYIMGLVGQNGAGKTTTIRLILNMIPRSNGNVKILGMDNIIEDQIIKQDIAAVFDETYFVDGWKIYDVEQAIKSFYANWSSALYYQYVKTFNLPISKKVKVIVLVQFPFYFKYDYSKINTIASLPFTIIFIAVIVTMIRNPKLFNHIVQYSIHNQPIVWLAVICICLILFGGSCFLSCIFYNKREL
jgi:ABC-type dipeptide/oligopeptide/nickel transport system ATPase component